MFWTADVLQADMSLDRRLRRNQDQKRKTPWSRKSWYDVLHRRTWKHKRYVSGGSGIRNLYFPGRCRCRESAIKALGLDDVVVEYEITSNRVDCYGVVGIAREAAATFDKQFCPPVVTEQEMMRSIRLYQSNR